MNGDVSTATPFDERPQQENVQKPEPQRSEALEFALELHRRKTARETESARAED